MKRRVETLKVELDAAGITGPEPRIYYGRAAGVTDKHGVLSFSSVAFIDFWERLNLIGSLACKSRQARCSTSTPALWPKSEPGSRCSTPPLRHLVRRGSSAPATSDAAISMGDDVCRPLRLLQAFIKALR